MSDLDLIFEEETIDLNFGDDEIIVELVQFGPKGDSGDGIVSVVHVQSVAQQVWTFVHNMGYRPSIHTYNATDEEIFGDVTNPDGNTAVITFAFDVSGTAYAS